MPSNIPSEEEVLGYYESPSNWGRWGDDDQMGTLNFVTHLDSLGHVFWEGEMYNGRPTHLISTSMGATVESIELAKSGIVTRGLLVDAPMVRGVDWLDRGDGVTTDDILKAEERCGFKIEEGDVLLVRTGQLHRSSVEGPMDHRVEGSTACDASCLPLFHERRIAMMGSDTGNDVIPAPYDSMVNPIHVIGIVAMGLWILDNLDLEKLAAACKQKDRWEFMVSIGPLRLSNTTGSPVNPIAVF